MLGMLAMPDQRPAVSALPHPFAYDDEGRASPHPWSLAVKLAAS
jgi:hypothetical protein